ncbi:MAG: hypothetical protein JXB05_12615 [Myxococcaceae bacterium]|nr:hypothetical protein [Myxococcaceae bacterium]
MNRSARSFLVLSLMEISKDVDSINSFYAVDYNEGLDLYSLRFGDGEVQLDGRVTRAYVLSGGVELSLPSEVTGGGGDGGMGSADAGPGSPGVPLSLSPPSASVEPFRAPLAAHSCRTCLAPAYVENLVDTPLESLPRERN